MPMPLSLDPTQCAHSSPPSQSPNVLYARNGEKIGSYNGHTGACTKMHVNGE